MKKYPPHISLKKPNGDPKTEKELEAEAKLPPPKKYYDVKLEAMAPITVTYRVLAESPEAALELINRSPPTHVRHVLNKKRNLKAVVYDAGSTLIRFTKAYLS